MDGWQNQNTGMGSTGWMPLYMMGSQMGAGQQPQTQLGPNGSAPPMGQPPMGQPPMGQPPMGQPPMGQSPLGQMSPVQNTGGPDRMGYAPGGGYAFDGSGSDAGVSGQPVNQMQTPWRGMNNFGQSVMRPPMLTDFRARPGRQIQGNPTSQPIGGGGIGSFNLGSMTRSGRPQQR